MNQLKSKPTRPEKFAIAFVENLNSPEDPEIKIEKFYQFLIKL
jgi:hypothetical protein